MEEVLSRETWRHQIGRHFKGSKVIQEAVKTDCPDADVITSSQTSLIITVEHADIIISKAFAKARMLELAPLCVAVVDSGGHLLCLRRDEFAAPGRPQIAIGKASGCLGLGVGGRTLAKMAIGRPSFMASLSSAFPNGCIPVPGGVLVRNDEGILLGAVGVTGDVSEQDEACAIAGIEAANLRADCGG